MRLLPLLALVACGAAQAQTRLPLPAGYPTLLGASCGGVHVASYVTGFDANGNISGEIYAWTRCGGSGRGGGYKSTTYQSWHSVVWDLKGNYKLLAAYDGIHPDPLFSAADRWGNTISDACNGSTNGQPACFAQAIVVYAPPTPPVSATVPALAGMSAAQAAAALQAAGLAETVYRQASATVAANFVCGQSISAGAVVDTGTAVNVCISLGASDTND